MSSVTVLSAFFSFAASEMTTGVVSFILLYCVSGRKKNVPSAPKICMGSRMTKSALAPRCSNVVPPIIATKLDKHASVNTNNAVLNPRSCRKNISPIAATESDSKAVVPSPCTMRPARRMSYDLVRLDWSKPAMHIPVPITPKRHAKRNCGRLPYFRARMETKHLHHVAL